MSEKKSADERRDAEDRKVAEDAARRLVEAEDHFENSPFGLFLTTVFGTIAVFAVVYCIKVFLEGL